MIVAKRRRFFGCSLAWAWKIVGPSLCFPTAGSRGLLFSSRARPHSSPLSLRLCSITFCRLFSLCALFAGGRASAMGYDPRAGPSSLVVAGFVLTLRPLQDQFIFSGIRVLVVVSVPCSGVSSRLLGASRLRFPMRDAQIFSGPLVSTSLIVPCGSCSPGRPSARRSHLGVLRSNYTRGLLTFFLSHLAISTSSSTANIIGKVLGQSRWPLISRASPFFGASFMVLARFLS